jgi:hypothetical protein
LTEKDHEQRVCGQKFKLENANHCIETPDHCSDSSEEYYKLEDLQEDKLETSQIHQWIVQIRIKEQWITKETLIWYLASKMRKASHG